MEDFDWDFFIAHAGSDRDAAEELYDKLALHARVFLDSRCLKLGDNWDEELAKAQRTSLITVVLVSSHSDQAYYQREEIAGAIAMARTNPSGHRVVPIYLDEVPEIPYGLRAKHGIRLNDQVRLTHAASKLLALFKKAEPEGPLSSSALIMAVMGAKGGVGKSTIACRIAEMLAETGHNILLIDLDTGASGSTILSRGKHKQVANTTSVYEILFGIGGDNDKTSGSHTVLEISPDYLAERESSGRVFLLPATPPQQGPRAATIDLLRRIEAGLHHEAMGRVMDRIMAQVESAPVPIHQIIIDCGAEGPEFNPLVTEAHARASLTYIVVQPDPISRQNLSHVADLLVKGTGPAMSSKIRVIVNRVVSPLHESVVKNQFSDFVVSGCIPDDPRLFEDIQKGRVDHRYGYDGISSAIRAILARGKDLPAEMIPDEANLWIRPTALALSDVAITDRVRRFVCRRAMLRLGGLTVIGMILFLYSMWQFVNLRRLPTDQLEVVLPSLVLHAVLSLVACVVVLYSLINLRQWWPRMRLTNRLNADYAWGPGFRMKLEETLRRIDADPSNRELLDWLRAEIAASRRVS